MMSSTKIIVILGLVWFGYAAAKITTLLSRKENLNGDTFKPAIIKQFKNRTYFPYATCKQNITSIDCKIFREPLDGKSNRKVCPVSFDGNSRTMRLLTFQDFDDDKVLINWYNPNDKLPNYYIRLTIVRFSDCSTSEARIKFDLEIWRSMNFARSLGAVLPDGDKFEVAFDNSGFYSDKIEKLTFDVRGYRIHDATTWFTPLNTQSAILMDKLENNNYVLFEVDMMDMMPPKARFSLLTEYGQKILSETELEDFQNDYHDISVLHDTIRFCRQMARSKSKIDCTTYNVNGVIKKNIRVDFDTNLKIVDVHNLADGSFLVTSWTSEKLYNITKFDDDGKFKATMELPGFRCDGEQHLKSYDDENNQHCWLIFCVGDDKFDIVNKCFGDNDIK